MTSLNDLSDEELEKIAGQQNNVQQLSDLELIRAATPPRPASVDVPLSIATEGAAGVGAIPRTLGDLFNTLVSFGVDPKETGQDVIRALANQIGIDIPKPEQEPSIAESILGQDKAQGLKERLGFQKAENVLGAAGRAIDPRIQQDVLPPGRQELVDLLETGAGTQLSGTTAPGRVLGQFAGRFTESLPFGGKAAGAFGAGGAAGQTLREVGAPEPVANIADFTVSLLALSKGGQPSTADLKKRQLAITEEKINSFNDKLFKGVEKPGSSLELGERISDSVKPITENVALELKDVPVNKMMQEIVESQRSPILNGVAAERTPLEALNLAKEESNVNFQRFKGQTANRYDEARQAIGDRVAAFDQTIEKIDNIIQNPQSLPIKGAARQQAVRIMEDLKSTLQKEEGGILLKDAITEKQSFNTLFDFEFPDLEAKSKLNNTKAMSSLRKTFRGELNTLIGEEAGNEAKSLFRIAENSHIRDANIFGKDVFIKLQRSESPLAIKDQLSKQENLRFLKSTLPESAESMSALDRLVLEDVDFTKTTAKLRRDIRDLQEQLGSNSKKASEALLDLNDPKSLSAKTTTTQAAILDEVGRVIVEGGDPSKIFNLMKNPKGLDVFEQTMNLTPQGRRAASSIKRAFEQEIFDSLTKNGILQPSKIRELLRNDGLVKSLERVSGKGSVDFLREFLKDSDRFDRMFKKNIFEKKSPKRAKTNTFIDNPEGFFEKNASNLGEVASILRFLNVKSAFILKTAKNVSRVGAKLPKLLNNKKVKSLLKTIEKRPEAAGSALLQLNRIIEKEIEED